MKWKKKKDDMTGGWEHYIKNKDFEIGVFQIIDHGKDLGWFWNIDVDIDRSMIGQDGIEMKLHKVCSDEEMSKTPDEAKKKAIKGMSKFFTGVAKEMKTIKEKINS